MTPSRGKPTLLMILANAHPFHTPATHPETRKLIWFPNPDGIFTIKSAYQFATQASPPFP